MFQALATGETLWVEQGKDGPFGGRVYRVHGRVGLSRVLFRQIPKGARLLAMGNFFKDGVPGAQWRLAAYLNQGNEIHSSRFDLEMSCVMGVGR